MSGVSAPPDVASLPPDEVLRLQALARCCLLDTPAEVDFDDFTHLAASLCATPMALISLVDAERQWFKSRVGVDLAQTPRDISFCAHTIRGKDLLEVPDARADLRFRNSPLVRGEPGVRFYAGVPLVTDEGYCLGTLCVLDRTPRQLQAEQREALRRLARLVTSRIQLRTGQIEQARREEAQQALARSHAGFVGQRNVRAAFAGLLPDLLALTRSAFGFIGEVLYEDDTEPYLKIQAITNIAWDDEALALYRKQLRGGMEFRRLDNLIGAVLTSGRPILTNSPMLDPRAGGLPPGHPPVNAFAGLPIHVGERLVGMVGLANCPGGYVPEVSERLSPMLSTIGMLIEARRVGEEARLLAWYDPLTGLPNRALLIERIRQTLAFDRRQGECAALLLLNIDRFKNLNDARGHAFGDALLKAVGARLAARMDENGTVARLGSDEFAVLLQGLSASPEVAGRQALNAAEQIRQALSQPFALDEDEVHITLSVGIGLLPQGDSDSHQDVLRRADTALHRAKAGGGNRCTFFDAAMGERAQERFAIERDLRRGIAAGELRLFLQAQVHADGRLAGAEALVRWQHPERGLLPPALFIAVAEESDLIIELGNWVLAEACRLLTVPAIAACGVRIAVNVSPRQFHRPDFVASVRERLDVSGANPARLTLEVTEGLVIEDVQSVATRMSELAALGIQFSIDDFGTGYSSLAYLKRLPISELKIDKSFVQDAPTDANDAALVETILAVAAHLHLKVVAEGVETSAQADFLNQRATVVHQGYLFARPEAAESWTRRWAQLPR